MIVALTLASFLALTMLFVFGPIGKLLDDVTPRPGATPPPPERFTTHDVRTIARWVGPAVSLAVFLLLLGPALPWNWANLLPASIFLVVPIAAFVLFALGGATVDLREDGALVHYRFARAVFYPYAEIDHALVNAHGDAAVVANGKRVFVIKSGFATGAAVIGLRRAVRLAQSTNDLSSVLASTSARELGQASQGRTSYRIAAPSRDELWTLVETGSAKRASRVAAADAIGTTATVGEIARLEAAAIASPDRLFRHAIALILRRAEEAEGGESAATGEAGRANERH